MNLRVDVALVPRQHHPLNRGLSPQTLLGIEGVRYSPHDRLGPIMDSMQMFELRSRGFSTRSKEEQLRLKRKNDEEERRKAPLTFLEILEGKPEPDLKPKANCPCVEKDPNLLVPSADGDCMVCSNCGIAGSTIMVSQHRAKACAAEDDKTTVADAPKVVTDRFAEAAFDLKTARQLKDGPKVATVATNRKILGFAPEFVRRLTEKADRARGQLSTKDQTRELQLLVRVEKLFKPLEPMPDDMKRYARVQSYTFFHAYVNHCNTCDKCKCRFTGLRDNDKHLQYLATACLATTMAQLEDGSCRISTVETEQLEAVLERHRETDTPAALRTAVREMRLFLDAAHNNTTLPPCEAGAQTVAREIATEDEEKRLAYEESEKEGGAFGRQLRTFLRKLHFVEGNELVEHTIQFYVGKYDRIQEKVEGSDLSWPAKAFAAMEVAARAKEGLGLDEPSARVRPALLASLGTTASAVMKFVHELHGQLNAGTSKDHALA